MGYCPSTCIPEELLTNPTANCSENPRFKTLDRILFMNCDTADTLPDPITNDNILPFFDPTNPLIVASSKLVLKVDDPTTQNIKLTNCDPQRAITATRVINFEDRIAISVLAGSPAVTDDYYDWDQWKQRDQLQMNIYFGFSFCDGDCFFARDINSKLIRASLQAFISFDETIDTRHMVFVKGKIEFQGDPLYFPKMEFNAIEAGITF